MVEFLEREGWASQGHCCLDVGGIPSFRPWFEARSLRYVSLSLGDAAMVCMDIQLLGFADETFDLVLDSPRARVCTRLPTSVERDVESAAAWRKNVAHRKLSVWASDNRGIR